MRQINVLIGIDPTDSKQDSVLVVSILNVNPENANLCGGYFQILKTFLSNSLTKYVSSNIHLRKQVETVCLILNLFMLEER